MTKSASQMLTIKSLIKTPLLTVRINYVNNVKTLKTK